MTTQLPSEPNQSQKQNISQYMSSVLLGIFFGIVIALAVIFILNYFTIIQLSNIHSLFSFLPHKVIETCIVPPDSSPFVTEIHKEKDKVTGYFEGTVNKFIYNSYHQPIMVELTKDNKTNAFSIPLTTSQASTTLSPMVISSNMQIGSVVRIGFRCLENGGNHFITTTISSLNQ